MTLLPTRTPGVEPVPVAVTWSAVGEVAVLRCVGDLDLGGVEAMSAAVHDALAHRPVGLVVDLTEVGFCDTVGLRLLLSTAAKSRAQGCAPALAAVQPSVAAFLARVCADRALPSYADVAAAIEGLMLSPAWR
jgi:anti-anti-sigma factor